MMDIKKVSWNEYMHDRLLQESGQEWRLVRGRSFLDVICASGGVIDNGPRRFCGGSRDRYDPLRWMGNLNYKRRTKIFVS